MKIIVKSAIDVIKHAFYQRT